MRRTAASRQAVDLRLERLAGTAAAAALFSAKRLSGSGSGGTPSRMALGEDRRTGALCNACGVGPAAQVPPSLAHCFFAVVRPQRSMNRATAREHGGGGARRPWTSRQRSGVGQPVAAPARILRSRLGLGACFPCPPRSQRHRPRRMRLGGRVIHRHLIAGRRGRWRSRRPLRRNRGLAAGLAGPAAAAAGRRSSAPAGQAPPSAGSTPAPAGHGPRWPILQIAVTPPAASRAPVGDVGAAEW